MILVMDQNPMLATAIVPVEVDHKVFSKGEAEFVRSHEAKPENDFSIRDSVNSVIDHFQGLLAGEISGWFLDWV